MVMAVSTMIFRRVEPKRRQTDTEPSGYAQYRTDTELKHSRRNRTATEPNPRMWKKKLFGPQVPCLWDKELKEKHPN